MDQITSMDVDQEVWAKKHKMDGQDGSIHILKINYAYSELFRDPTQSLKDPIDTI